MLSILILLKHYGVRRTLGGLLSNLNGKSRGILTMWDEGKISVTEVLKGGYSLSIKCTTICKKIWWITNVYGPSNYRERKYLWPKLLSLSAYCMEPWCFKGDFNITRRPQEHFPLGRLTRGMRKFNSFIANMKLLEIPLSNGRLGLVKVLWSHVLPLIGFLSLIIAMRCLKTLSGKANSNILKSLPPPAWSPFVYMGSDPFQI